MPTPTRWQAHRRYPYLLAKYGGVAIIIGAVLALLYRLRVVVIPIMFSLLFAYILSPAVGFLHRRGIPRTLGSILMVLVSLVVLTAVVLLVIPTLFVQFIDLVQRFPLMLDVLDQSLSPLVEQHLGIKLHFDALAMTQTIQDNIKNLAAPTGWLLSYAFKSALNLGLAVVNLVIVVVFTFYLLRSYPEIGLKGMEMLPARYRNGARVAINAVDDALSGFIRGQIIVSLTMACIYSVALTIIGISGGTIIGIIAGLLNFVPYLGIFIGLILSLLSVALDYSGAGQVIAVLAVFGGVPLLDATLITPNIIGNRVGINPFLVIVALLAGGELLGFLGLLLAVPSAAVIRALVMVSLESYKRSRFYLGDGDESEEPPPRSEPG
ncbi:MAG: AI-2E family transporter [Deltaproteobacteria bacterium]|nr:AI-2E family transporter [Deltaproteobacteria bacterium]